MRLAKAARLLRVIPSLSRGELQTPRVRMKRRRRRRRIQHREG
jgi:hypothetical protein